MDKRPLSFPSGPSLQYHEFWQVYDLENPELLPGDLFPEEIGIVIPAKYLFASNIRGMF